MAISEQEWLNSGSVNYGNTPMDYGSQSKPWYQNEQFAGAVAGGINGITQYLLEQEKLRGQKSLQQDALNWRTNQENAAVQRSSAMPLLQRFTKPKKR